MGAPHFHAQQYDSQSSIRETDYAKVSTFIL